MQYAMSGHEPPPSSHHHAHHAHGIGDPHHHRLSQPMLMSSQHYYQQLQQPALPGPSNASASIMVISPDGSALDDFKNDVRTWVELDNSIRRMQAALKERRAAKGMLTERILGFMNRYNIEDLNTKDARLRYRVAYIRVPLSHQTIKDRIATYFGEDARVAKELQGHLFGNRERSEQSSLRRLKIA